MEPTPVTEIIASEIGTTEEITNDVDEVATQLAEHDRISAEQRTAILERVNGCHDQLQVLSSRLESTQAESPILSQLLQAVTEIRAEMETLKSALQSLKDSTHTIPPTPSESIAIVTPEVPVEPSPEESTVEPEQAAPEPPKPRRKFRLL